MPASTDYIPAKIADFALWLDNFADLIAATPVAFGLTAPDAVAISAENTTFQTAFSVSTTPATRTSATVAATKGARESAVAICRPFAMRINANQSVSDLQRVELGLTVRTVVPTPVPPPSTTPVLSLRGAIANQFTLDFRDSANPDPKAKPQNVLSCEVVMAIGVAAAVDPNVLPTAMVVTKTPFALPLPNGSAGKIVTLFARWRNRSGAGGVSAAGPWSPQFTSNAI